MSPNDELIARYNAIFGTSAQWSSERNGLRVARYVPKSGVMLEPTTELFVTAGMSARPMAVTDPQTPSRVELLIVAPSNWRENYKSKDGDDCFLVDTLRTTADYPFARGTFLADLHTLPAGRALAPQTEMCGWVFTKPIVLRNVDTVAMPYGNVSLLLMTPLHPMELSFARAKGTMALMDRLFGLVETLGLDWGFFLQPKRPDTVGGTTIIA